MNIESASTFRWFKYEWKCEVVLGKLYEWYTASLTTHYTVRLIICYWLIGTSVQRSWQIKSSSSPVSQSEMDAWLLLASAEDYFYCRTFCDLELESAGVCVSVACLSYTRVKELSCKLSETYLSKLSSFIVVFCVVFFSLSVTRVADFSSSLVSSTLADDSPMEL